MKWILFSERHGMLHAFVKNIKVQTRQVVKLDPWRGYEYERRGEALISWDQEHNTFYAGRFEVNEIRYVKEAFRIIKASEFPVFRYPAIESHAGVKWTSPLFLKKEHARFFLKVTAVRFERVSEISEGDAVREGVESVSAYRRLWNEINRKPKPVRERGTKIISFYASYPFCEEDALPFTQWKGNPLISIPDPWVEVIDFKRLDFRFIQNAYPAIFGQKSNPMLISHYGNWMRRMDAENPPEIIAGSESGYDSSGAFYEGEINEQSFFTLK